ncbi:MAG: hypothetical protein KDA70_08425 [Planctomycetaceae bacterium]|nr:hypothetical protein [Planctomycetaceae bacterium]
MTTLITGGQCVLATLLVLLYSLQVFFDLSLVRLPQILKIADFNLLMLDGISSLMFSLVSFVGWIICRYSVRYLDGESEQGNYFRWTGFTVGAVSLMAISGNLLLFILSWSISSLGLHQLLLFYRNRPAAQRAAWTKFTVSRLGDMTLIAATILIYQEFQTLNISEIFDSFRLQSEFNTPQMMWAISLLVAGAVLKSAQFPFHTWLPQTLDTPTPVSALMHAGIVNAGGYLMIRTSPLLFLNPTAMSCLALIGTVTTCYAATVMLTQNSIKKKLAYSTIAQMGFMMLQCGLGAFSAAMLHILAHSLYKAHAFLNSGNVLEQNRAAGWNQTVHQDQQGSPVKLLIAGACILLAYFSSLSLFGIDPLTKPGGILLGFILCLALLGWMRQALQANNRSLLIRAAGISLVLCLAYSLSFVVIDKLVGLPQVSSNHSYLAWTAAALIILGFCSMSLLHRKISQTHQPTWINKLYIHAINGFYIEAILRQRFRILTR